MAIQVDRITVAAPTLNAITLGAGGSLEVGVTYYYRAIALRSYEGRYALSAASAEQSVTPTSGNQTAQLSWPAVDDATAYIIQRTTTSGSYPVEGANTFNLYQQSYTGYPFATTLTSLNDNGGAGTNIRFNSNNLDFDTEHALIKVYSDANEVVTLWDIASALAGGGFTDLSLQGSAALQAGTNWRAEGLYHLRGFLYIYNCIFRLYGPIIGLPGDIYTDANLTLEVGHATTNYSPVFLHLGMPSIAYTNNNNTWAGVWYGGWQISGRVGFSNIMRLFIERYINYNLVGNYGCMQTDRYGARGILYADMTESILGKSASDGIQIIPTINSANNILESLFLLTTIRDSTIRLGKAVETYNKANIIMERCVTRNLTNADVYLIYNWQRGVSIIDHTFMAKGQTDNQPYLYVQKLTSEVATAILSVTRNFLVLDADGPVQDAVITALNANGLSAFWEDSLATFSTALDATTDPASLTVSDGTKFSVGNYIRCETYGECLRVTNIAGNVLTVARGQLGTSMRKTVTSNNNRVLKMLDSLTTDANGEAGGDEATLQRELYSVSGSGSQTNYEDTLITNGYLARNFYGPYALQIAKEGYQTYTCAFLDPDVDKYPLGPVTLEIGLSVVPPPVYVSVPGGEMDITLEDLQPLEAVLEAAEITVELSDG